MFNCPVLLSEIVDVLASRETETLRYKKNICKRLPTKLFCIHVREIVSKHFTNKFLCRFTPHARRAVVFTHWLSFLFAMTQNSNKYAGKYAKMRYFWEKFCSKVVNILFPCQKTFTRHHVRIRARKMQKLLDENGVVNVFVPLTGNFCNC